MSHTDSSHRIAPTLDVVQRWMLEVITHPQGIAAGLAAPDAQTQMPLSMDELEHVVSPSSQCSSVERLAVYGNAYYARLIECLSEDFPSVRSVLGEETFATFVVQYLQEFPSRSYTLTKLGEGFPAFLQRSRPERTGADSLPDWADFVIDLATLERCDSEVFDGDGEEEQSPPADPPAQSNPGSPLDPGAIHIQLSAALRLLSLKFPVQDVIRAVHRDENFEVPAAAETRLAVWRRDYIVRHMVLPRTAYRLLLSLQQGAVMEAALASAAGESQGAAQELNQSLGSWFRDWTKAGIVLGPASQP